MSVDQEIGGVLYQVWNWLVLPFWLLLIFFPSWKFTELVVRMHIGPLLFAVLYISNGIVNFFYPVPISDAIGAFAANVTTASSLFSPEWFFFGISNIYSLTLAWVHYLAFDLFVGGWIVRDSRFCGMPHLFVVPCLVLTIALGPVGLFVYMCVRYILTRSVPEKFVLVNDTKKRTLWFLIRIWSSENWKTDILDLIYVWIGYPEFWIKLLCLREFGILKKNSTNLANESTVQPILREETKNIIPE